MINKTSDWDLFITPNRGWFEINFSEIFNYKDLLWLFVKRDYTTQFKQTILGPIWFILQPLLYTIVFTIIFNGVAKIPIGTTHPLLFYMSGIIAWNYFSSCLSTTSGTFLSNAGLFGKVYFPRIIVPLSKSISGLIKLFVQLLLFLGFLIFFQLNDLHKIKFSFEILILLPLLIIQIAILGQGLGMIISSLTVRYRDLTYLVSFGTQLLMYASPIVYPLKIVPENYKNIIIANPLTGIIEIFRGLLLSTENIDFSTFFYSIAITIFTFLIGLIFFNKTEQNFIDSV